MGIIAVIGFVIMICHLYIIYMETFLKAIDNDNGCDFCLKKDLISITVFYIFNVFSKGR